MLSEYHTTAYCSISHLFIFLPLIPSYSFPSTITSTSPVTVFYASMTSGLIYSVITMPLETAKNRMAFQKPDAVTGQMNGHIHSSIYYSSKLIYLFLFTFLLFSLLSRIFCVHLILSPITNSCPFLSSYTSPSSSPLSHIPSSSPLSHIPSSSPLSHIPSSSPLSHIPSSSPLSHIPSSSLTFLSIRNTPPTGILPYRGAFQTMSAIAGKEGTYCTLC
jgi:hypothetical protein